MWGDYCTYCGMALDGNFPKKCAHGHMTYLSPLGVGVALQPVIKDGTIGLLGVLRNIPPHKGGIALPGGFADNDDTQEQTACRELWEETRIRQETKDARYHSSFVGSSHDDQDQRHHIVSFFSMPPLDFDAVDWSVQDHEVTKLVWFSLSADRQNLERDGERLTLCFHSHHTAALNFLLTNDRWL